MALVRSPTADALDSLTRAIHLLDRGSAPSVKVAAFRRAAEVVESLGDPALADLVARHRLTGLDGIGPSTAEVISAAVEGRPSAYLQRLDQATAVPVSPEAARYLRALRGDCHSHTTWSDGGADLEHMAQAAVTLGHDYLVITDHSPRLTVAHGLDPERLARQLDEIERVNTVLAPFRLLRGIEVDILVDGSLDLPDDLLSRLDVVVASVHSELRMDRAAMTARLVRAVANPHVDVLGHCTGRKVMGRGRPPSHFDADVVFHACHRFDTAVEINCRPERQDPPDELMKVALEWGCRFAIDTDAHATGQLEWLGFGCDKAARHHVPLDDIVNTWTTGDLLDWTADHPVAP